MSSLLQPNHRPMPVVLSTLALVLFYLGLFHMPVPGRLGAEPSPEESRRLVEDSAALRRFGQWSRALKPTLRLHRYYPENPIYMAQLGEIYDRMGRYPEAAAIWELFLDHSPTPIEGCPQIGQAYEKQGLAKRAIAAFERCLAIQPGNPDSIFYLARALERDQEIDHAAALYEEGMTSHPEYADLAIGLARMRLRQARTREASDLAGGVVARQPGNVDALLVLGLACRQLGDREGARMYLRRGVDLADGYADFHVVLGQIAEEDADLDGAILHYQKAAALDRSNAAVAQRLAVLRRARP